MKNNPRGLLVATMIALVVFVAVSAFGEHVTGDRCCYYVEHEQYSELDYHLGILKGCGSIDYRACDNEYDNDRADDRA